MRNGTIHREPDQVSHQSLNAAWQLLRRRDARERNLAVIVQRFEPGGSFEDHAHDLDQFFFVTRGRFEMTINGHTAQYGAGEFIVVPRNQRHAGRNLDEGPSELLVIDHWPADSHDTLGLE